MTFICYLDNQLKLSKSLLQSPLVIEKTTVCEFSLDPQRPIELKTPLGTPILRPVQTQFGACFKLFCSNLNLFWQNTSDNSISQSIHSELEVVRGGNQRDDISYDNPLTNASAISGWIMFALFHPSNPILSV